MATAPMADDRKRKFAADLFKKGTEAMMKQNWDYAINSFRQAVKLTPENLLCRQSLRGCQERKYGDNGSGAKMAGMRLMGIRTNIKKLRYQKNWAAIEQEAENGLDLNPWDGQLNGDLAEALRELGYNEPAVYSYERAVKGEPNSKEYNRALAVLLEERGEYERAIECWRRIRKIDKFDPTATSKITALEASAVMDRGGYNDAESTQGVLNDKQIAKKLKLNQGEADGPGQSVEADLQRAIRKNPANKDNYLKLADYYKRAQQLESAEEQLRKALEVSGGDLSIREILEDVQLDRMKQTVVVAKEDAQKNKEDSTFKKRYQELTTELLQRELEVLARRVERYPADMRLKFELGLRYIADKRHQMAIPMFQASRMDPRVKADALVNLGKCFIADKQHSLAERQFVQSIPEIKFDEKPDLFKEMYYFLGRVREQQGNIEGAIEAYQEVLAVDYNYRDIQDRLRKLEGGEQKKIEEQ